jgi:hypothetical protein
LLLPLGKVSKCGWRDYLLTFLLPFYVFSFLISSFFFVCYGKTFGSGWPFWWIKTTTKIQSPSPSLPPSLPPSFLHPPRIPSRGLRRRRRRRRRRRGRRSVIAFLDGGGAGGDSQLVAIDGVADGSVGVDHGAFCHPLGEDLDFGLLLLLLLLLRLLLFLSS